MSMVIVGVMGPGEGATDRDCALAYELGCAIAREGWVLLTGGRAAGVMNAASRGAKEAGGLTIGVLPLHDKSEMSPFVDIPIVTGMGEARNYVNVLSSDVVFACGMGAGTASEVALAIKSGRQVVLLGAANTAADFFGSLARQRINTANDVAQAMEMARALLRWAHSVGALICDLEGRDMDALKLIPQVFFDAIARVVPGAFCLVYLQAATRAPILQWIFQGVVPPGPLQTSSALWMLVVSVSSYVVGHLMSPAVKYLEWSPRPKSDPASISTVTVVQIATRRRTEEAASPIGPACCQQCAIHPAAAEWNVNAMPKPVVCADLRESVLCAASSGAPRRAHILCRGLSFEICIAPMVETTSVNTASWSCRSNSW